MLPSIADSRWLQEGEDIDEDDPLFNPAIAEALESAETKVACNAVLLSVQKVSHADPFTQDTSTSMEGREGWEREREHIPARRQAQSLRRGHRVTGRLGLGRHRGLPAG